MRVREREKEEGVRAVGVRSQEAAALSADREVIDKTMRLGLLLWLRGGECKCRTILSVWPGQFCWL